MFSQVNYARRMTDATHSTPTNIVTNIKSLSPSQLTPEVETKTPSILLDAVIESVNTFPTLKVDAQYHSILENIFNE